MKSVTTISLSERFVNLFQNDTEKKKEYAPVVWDMLQAAYRDIGGLKTGGLDSPESLLDFPMWKLVRKDGEILLVVLYKDSGGRKSVALATNGSRTGKRMLGRLLGVELSRAYMEVSGPLLGFLMRLVPEETIEEFVFHYGEVEEVLHKKIQPPPPDDDEVAKYPRYADCFYQRIIGGHYHTKLLIGSPGKPISLV